MQSQVLDFNMQNSINQMSSFECTCFSTPHVYGLVITVIIILENN